MYGNTNVHNAQYKNRYFFVRIHPIFPWNLHGLSKESIMIPYYVKEVQINNYG